MHVPTNKTITDDKSKSSITAHLVTHANAETREMELLVPKLRAAIEGGNLPEARKCIEAIGAALGSTMYTLEYVSDRTGVSLYTQEEMTKAAEGIEKGYDDSPKMKKSSLSRLY